MFYPPKRGRPKSFDELAWYAEHFNTVEINATFYGQPRADVARAWVERTPPGFDFSIKLYQKFTHPRMFQERIEKSLPAELDGSIVEELARPNAADLDKFRRGIEPLAQAGKLGAILAQFPPSFKNGAVEQAYLVDLLQALRSYPVAVELRHRSWSDAFGETLDLLNASQAAWVQIDEPKFNFSIRQNFLPNLRGFYYMRLHGRNVANWWRHEHAEDRYNYLYSANELREFTDVASAARTLVKKLYLYANNHFSAKSVANAAMIKEQLGEPVEGSYPEEFVARYPELSGLVSTRPAVRARLFAE